MIHKSDLVEQAQTLGFYLGVAECQPPLHTPLYGAWLRAGRQAGMAYLASERWLQTRADPSQLLPGCRSILCLAASYPSPLSLADAEIPALHGRVAAYAWEPDYHLTFPPKLEKMGRWLQDQSAQPVSWFAASDSQPVAERETAARAGLGWIGKNSCLILPQKGSCFLLAELLTDLALEPDAPAGQDRCGSCTRCQQACPTGCILPDRTIDAGRCLSYLTIENKGSIPRELRKPLGNRIFGCDVCQSVCPWNQSFSTRQFRPEWLSEAAPPLLALIELTPDGFKQRFTRSAILRTKRRGLLRNVCVALGNQAGPEAENPLRKLMESEPEGLIRVHAAWALGRIGGKENRRFLESALQREEDALVRSEITLTLEESAP